MSSYDGNPWFVSNLDEFLQYCCPECDEKYESKEPFVLHAFEKHPKAKDWANRMEEIYLTGELWGYDNMQADQYTMAIGRDSFKDCKQMDLMKYHPGLKNSDPVPKSPLAEFLVHMKGDKKHA